MDCCTSERRKNGISNSKYEGVFECEFYLELCFKIVSTRVFTTEEITERSTTEEITFLFMKRTFYRFVIAQLTY